MQNVHYLAFYPSRKPQAFQISVQGQRSESKAAALLENLRELPSAQALKLRASIALQLAAIKRQNAALDKEVYKLYTKGF